MKKFVGVVAALSLATGGAALASGAQAAPVLAGGTSRTGASAAGTANLSASRAGSSDLNASATSSTAFTPKPIKWVKCPASTGLVGDYAAQCGWLTVPLDYAHPKGTMIKLRVSRIKHTTSAKKYQGVMLVNPGGPGGSGLSLSVLGRYVPKKAGYAYDWIGFDPRGVGASKPSLACDAKYVTYNRPSYIPTTTTLETTWLQRTKAYAAACHKAGGKLLDHVKTTDTVQDMDSLRKALGRKQINFYGFSYGSYLGQVYSTKYPTRVRRMVLDGVVDPRQVWYKANLDQDVAFERVMKVYFAWVAKYDSVYHLGSTEAAVETAFYAAQTKLGQTPGGGKIGADEWNDVFLDAGYSVYSWEELTTVFAAYVNDGDWKPVKELFDDSNPQTKGSDNGYAMYLATQCTDVTWPKTWSTWRQDNDATYAQAPFLTWSNAWFNAPCINWAGKAGTPVVVNGKKAPAILLINETLDGATPYSGALEVRKRYPKSVLVEGVGGTTHAGSLYGVACTDNTIASYLSTGKLPKRVAGNTSDKKCAPNPQPNPTVTGLAAAGNLSTAAANPLSRSALQQLVGKP